MGIIPPKADLLLARKDAAINLGDTGFLTVSRPHLGVVQFTISEKGLGGGLVERASVHLSEERTKHIIIALCDLCGIRYNRSDV